MARSYEQRVLQALEDLQGAATSDRILEELGWENNINNLRRLGSIISRLVEQGLVKRRERVAVYELPRSASA